MTTSSRRTGADYIELGAPAVTAMHEENNGTDEERIAAIAARFQVASRRRRAERISGVSV
jgi:hypothetical protein